MTNFYVRVLQARMLLDANPGAVLTDAAGNEISSEYLNSLISLLDQISMFDPATDLQYIWPDGKTDFRSLPADGAVCDVLATSRDGLASFIFHIDSHGWWGYELAGDTLMNKLMSEKDTDGNPIEGNANKALAAKYGNFFVIKMSEDDKGTWYMLKDTDLEAPYLFISKDGSRAALIDTDFYGENVLNSILKSLLGDSCKELKILITHNHGDHTNNLAVIARDPYLKSIAEIYWPEGEAHTKVNGTDVVSLFDKVHYVKDMENIDAGGTNFQFIQVPQEHTPMGGAFADPERNLFFSGDTLGAQIHLGGTTVNTQALDSWISGVQKLVNYIDEHGIKVNFGGHTNYACSADFAKWMLSALEAAKTNLENDPYWSGLIIIENGQIASPDRMKEMMANGLSDNEELSVLSANFRNPNKKPADPENPEEPEKPADPSDPVQNPENPDTLQPENTGFMKGNASKPAEVQTVSKQKSVKASDQVPTASFSSASLFSLSALFAAAGALFFRRKRN